MPADHVTWHHPTVDRTERWSRLGLVGTTVWFTGLSGSGKSTIAAELEGLLVAAGRPTAILDADNLRHGLNRDLGFSPADRHENVRRTAEVSLLMATAGLVTLVPIISPYRSGRDHARRIHRDDDIPFVEVYVETSLEECEQRDPKGLYQKARAGEIPSFTGIDDPYEPPLQPELTLPTADTSARDLARRIYDVLPGS
jgi:adenylyl-sulfate kinase